MLWAVLVAWNAGPKYAVKRFAQGQETDRPLSIARWQVWVSTICPVLSMAYLVIMIEITIAWNRIIGANSMDSVGQLLPFIIGIARLGKVVYRTIKERLMAVDVDSQELYCHGIRRSVQHSGSI